MPLTKDNFQDHCNKTLVDHAIKFVQLLEATGVIFDPDYIITLYQERRIRSLFSGQSFIMFHFRYHSVVFEYDDNSDEVIFTFHEFYDSINREYNLSKRETKEVKVKDSTDYSQFINRIVELNY